MFLSQWREFPSRPCLVGKKKKLDDSSRLDVAEMARVPDMLPSLFPTWSGYEFISTPGIADLKTQISSVGACLKTSNVMLSHYRPGEALTAPGG